MLLVSDGLDFCRFRPLSAGTGAGGGDGEGTMESAIGDGGGVVMSGVLPDGVVWCCEAWS